MPLYALFLVPLLLVMALRLIANGLGADAAHRAGGIAKRYPFCPDAFSSREPEATSLENAILLILTRFLHANRDPLRSKTLSYL